MLAPGEKFDRYRIVRLLGEGGMATVFEAESPLGINVVLKVLNLELASDPEVRERFRREGQIQYTLRHPHIARVTDIVEDNGVPALVVDLMRGRDLAAEIEGGRTFSLEEVLKIGIKLLDALRVAHEHGFIHRDIKPGNIFLEKKDYGFEPVLMDFGIAKIEEAAALTRAREFAGTPAYASPEQIESTRDVDPRSDVYSFGVVMWELLAGQEPYAKAGDDPIAILVAVIREPIGPLPPSVPKWLSEVIERATQKKPDARYESAEAFRDALLIGAGEDPVLSETVVMESRSLLDEDGSRPVPRKSIDQGPRKRTGPRNQKVPEAAAVLRPRRGPTDLGVAETAPNETVDEAPRRVEPVRPAVVPNATGGHEAVSETGTRLRRPNKGGRRAEQARAELEELRMSASVPAVGSARVEDTADPPQAAPGRPATSSTRPPERPAAAPAPAASETSGARPLPTEGSGVHRVTSEASGVRRMPTARVAVNTSDLDAPPSSGESPSPADRNRGRLGDRPVRPMRRGGPVQATSVTIRRAAAAGAVLFVVAAAIWFAARIFMEPTGVPAGFVRVEPTTFVMGSPDAELGRDRDETQHEVTLTYPFAIQTHEVTREAYEGLMFERNNPFDNCGPDCPAVNVGWMDALEYANLLSMDHGYSPCYRFRGQGRNRTVEWPDGIRCTGYRLPTEAEWELAARAGTTAATWMGDITAPGRDTVDPLLDQMAWYGGNSEADFRGAVECSWNPNASLCAIHPVGEKAPNPLGLYDIYGNVAEWVWDAYADYGTDARQDPTGPEAGRDRIARGGSWMDRADDCRSASREAMQPLGRVSVGFRLVRTLER